jgi:dTDP-4-amino-4,6-dideoxygalactose transaminase
MNKEKKHIFLSSPHMSEEGYEKQFVQEAFDTNWIAPLGKNVDEFEREMAGKVGAKTAVALSAGTAAIHMALKSIGIQRGDIVLCSTLTFSATANPIIYEGAIPVFIDSEYDTWNMSPAALEKAILKYEREGKKPKAVLVVHLYGLMARIDEICDICHAHKIAVVEDAAESLGTTYKGKYTGTFGDYGIISFNGNKIITSSGGGMLLLNNEDAVEKADKVRFWATQARDKARWYQHSEIGYNYRMSNIVAGIGRGQLKVLDERVEKKQYIYQYYKREIGALPGVKLMPMQKDVNSNCWLTCAYLEPQCRVRPIDVMTELEKNDVESRPVWKPMHLQPVFAGCDFLSDKGSSFEITDLETGADDSVAGDLFENGVCLPSDTKMNDEDLARVCGVIKNLWE